MTAAVSLALKPTNGQASRIPATASGTILKKDDFVFIKVIGIFFKSTARPQFRACNVCADKKWREGKTGFPLVDAGMRELNTTGFMHNRARLVAASFLTKDLHIDWRWGEEYFAQQLVDYDPCVNNGNWQWVASTGADAQPYFRILNPWLQQKKFDPHCVYIKKWIPELQNIAPKIIHTWYTYKKKSTYPKSILDHEIESKKAKKIYEDKSRVGFFVMKDWTKTPV